MKTLTVAIETKEPREFCGTEGDLKFAGVHLLVELWTSFHLTDADRIRNTVENAE